MVKGFYDATAGLHARSIQQDTISNNLANVSTEGYRTQRLAFRNLLDHKLVVDRPGGTVEAWNKFEEGRYDITQQGPLRSTGNPLDIAIEGEGYFSIETADGPAYTRNGCFTRDVNGRLVAAGGNPVRMEGGGELQLPAGSEVLIGKDGTVRIDDSVVGKLELVNWRADAKLERLGENLIRPIDDTATTGGVAVQQGMLEDSNVNSMREMVDMIMTQRMFESLSKSLTTTDDTLRVAINDIGRTQ